MRVAETESDKCVWEKQNPTETKHLQIRLWFCTSQIETLFRHVYKRADAKTPHFHHGKPIES